MKQRIVFWAIICWLFVNGQFKLGLFGAEFDQPQKEIGTSLNSNSIVTDFTKTSICGYQLGTVMNDSLLIGTKKTASFGQPFLIFSYYNQNPSNFWAVDVYEKRLKEFNFKYKEGSSLFHTIKLFFSKKDHNLVAICLESTSKSYSNNMDLLPIIKDILSRKYNIKTWDNKANKYFNFLKNDELTIEGDKVKRKRAFYFDDKTLVYLLCNYRTNYDETGCHMETFFINVKGLNSTIEYINEERRKQNERRKQESLDQQRRKQQELQREVDDAEKSL